MVDKGRPKAQQQGSLCTEGEQQYIGEVGTNCNENEKYWPFQGGVTALRGPCKRQIQYLKKRCTWNRKETVLQPWLSVTKLSVSNTTVAVAHLINVTIDVMSVTAQMG